MTTRSIYRRRPRRTQAGMAAISLALLLLLMTGVMLWSQYLTGDAASGRVDAEQKQRIDLRWAEDSLNAFAAMHGRLPCPASGRGLAENCSGGAKGWLPVQTLERFGAAQISYSRLDVRYGVYRGTGVGAIDADLAIASEAFTPTLPDKQSVKGYPDPATAPIISGLDLCAKLRGLYPTAANRWALAPQLSGGPGRQDRLYTLYGPPGNVLNVAYALAVAAPGAGIAASAINADIKNIRFESPDRPLGPQYSDMVKIAGVPSLYQSMGCATTMASLDMLATARSWTDDADATRQSNIDSAADALPTAAAMFYTTADAIGLGSAILGVEIAAETLAKTAFEITTECPDILNPIAIAKCIAAIAAMPVANVGLILAKVTVATSTIGLAFDIASLGVRTRLSTTAAEVPVWSGADAILRQADQQGISDE